MGSGDPPSEGPGTPGQTLQAERARRIAFWHKTQPERNFEKREDLDEDDGDNDPSNGGVYCQTS